MISTVTNENLYEYRGNTVDFEAVKDSAEFNNKTGVGSLFLVFDADTGTSKVYILNEDATTHAKSWVELQ